MSELADVALPESVTLADGEGGLPLLRVRAPGGAAEVYLHGAQVTAWTPAGQAPVIWMSRRSLFEPGRAIRGGVPICFPWFGPGRNGEMSPAHGFARVADWKLDGARQDGDAVVVTLRLTDGDVVGLPGAELWPYRFEALYRITVGAELGLELSVRNTGAEAVTFEEALHTYLGVSDVREVQVDGLDGATYADKTSGGALVRQEGPVVFTGETDRVYRSSADVSVRDGARTMVVATTDSAEHGRLEPLGRQSCGDVGLRRRGVADDGVRRDRQPRRRRGRSRARAEPCRARPDRPHARRVIAAG